MTEGDQPNLNEYMICIEKDIDLEFGECKVGDIRKREYKGAFDNCKIEDYFILLSFSI